MPDPVAGKGPTNTLATNFAHFDGARLIDHGRAALPRRLGGGSEQPIIPSCAITSGLASVGTSSESLPKDQRAPRTAHYLDVVRSVGDAQRLAATHCDRTRRLDRVHIQVRSRANLR